MLKNSSNSQWQHPKELLKIQKLKLKKQVLQERICGSFSSKEKQSASSNKETAFENIFKSKKRKNPFALKDHNNKKLKSDNEILSETSDQTLFKLINQTSSCLNSQEVSLTTFGEVLSKVDSTLNAEKQNDSVRSVGSTLCPIDWTLKRKIRLISLKPFAWSHKLKISEEASGITSFTRCLDIENCETSLDVSPNAKFHQCCLYWQQPFFPWLTLFPRNTLKSNAGINIATSELVKSSLYEAWTDSLKSLYQLVRTRQCPYFYVCANNFTALFRAAGILGYTDLHVMVTPTTQGFRKLLQKEEIEFKMPLKVIQVTDSYDDSQEEDTEINMGYDELDEDSEKDWLANLNINAEDIKNINYTQARIEHKAECQVDSSDQSLIIIEGVEVNSFFNFLINCKSAISPTGNLAGVPPTLLAPVSFHGATLNALKVRESKVHSEGIDYHSLELIGPILPSTIHNIFNINNPDHSITMISSDIESTRVYSKVHKKGPKESKDEQNGTIIFGKENLSDCGLNSKVLKHFCSASTEFVCNIDCLKYSGENHCFTWI